MEVGYGLISCQISPGDPRGWEQIYAEALDLAELADRVGLDSLWTTEHHFVDDGYMPSLLVTSAAIAARTERIRIGTGVVLAPLHDPLRLAEDAATVALISGGRLVLGLGLGWSEVEFAGLGVDRTKRGALMTEILEILPRAWSGEPIVWDGPLLPMEQVAVRPVPTDPIPIVIGGGADAALRRAARLSDGFFSNATPQRFVEQAAVVNETRDALGIDRPFHWIYYGIVHLCDDPDRGWEEIRDSVRLMSWKYGDMEASAARTGPVPPPPPADPRADTLMRERVLIGTAEQVAARVLEIRDSVGVPFDFVARSYFADRSYPQLAEQVERIAGDLAPILRGA